MRRTFKPVAPDSACSMSARIASFSGLDLLYPALVRAFNLLQRSIVVSDYKRGVLAQDTAALVVGAIAALDAQQHHGEALPLVTGPHAGALLAGQVNELILQGTLRLPGARRDEALREQIAHALRPRQPACAMLSDALRIVLAAEVRRLHAAGLRRLLVLPRTDWPGAKVVQADLAERMAQLDYLAEKMMHVGEGLLALRIIAVEDGATEAEAHANGTIGAMCASRIAAATGCAFRHATSDLPWQCEVGIFLKMSAVLDQQVKALFNFANRLLWQQDSAALAGSAVGIHVRAARDCVAALSLISVQAAGHHAAICAAGSQVCLEQDVCLTWMARYLFRNLHLVAEASLSLHRLLRSLPLAPTPQARQPVRAMPLQAALAGEAILQNA